MKHLMRPSLLLAMFGLIGTSAEAHYNMLLPAKASAKKDETVTFLHQWGHPFEHQLFHAPEPEELTVLAPDGTVTSHGPGFLQATKVSAGKQKDITAFRFSIKPEQRGDYVLVLKLPPIWMEEDQEFLQDTVKVVLHVQAQKGWDQKASNDFELVPLTRPYGLRPGMVFQVRVPEPLRQVDPLPKVRPPAANGDVRGHLVEIERYNPEPPRDLPADEHITYSVRTDPNGVATCTLPDPGWWCITAQRDGGMKERQGKKFPVKLRTTLWVFVDEKLK